MKIIIAGGRDFDDIGLLNRSCNRILSKLYSGPNERKRKIEIVSGGARGADAMGEAYAVTCSFKVKRFPANWNAYGKSAGYIRNEEMAEYADALIAFWDGESKGTKHMIDLAKKHKLKVRVIKYGHSNNNT